MAARVATTRRFLADSGQELNETYRSQTNESPRRDLPLLGHRLGHDRVAGNAWKVRFLKSLSRRWVKSAITNQSRLTACDQIERLGMEGTSITSTEALKGTGRAKSEIGLFILWAGDEGHGDSGGRARDGSSQL